MCTLAFEQGKKEKERERERYMYMYMQVCGHYGVDKRQLLEHRA